MYYVQKWFNNSTKYKLRQKQSYERVKWNWYEWMQCGCAIVHITSYFKGLIWVHRPWKGKICLPNIYEIWSYYTTLHTMHRGSRMPYFFCIYDFRLLRSFMIALQMQKYCFVCVCVHHCVVCVSFMNEPIHIYTYIYMSHLNKTYYSRCTDHILYLFFSFFFFLTSDLNTSMYDVWCL